MDLSSCFIPVFSFHDISNAIEKPAIDRSIRLNIQESLDIIVVYGGVSQDEMSTLHKWLEVSSNHSLYLFDPDASRLKSTINLLRNSSCISQIKICLENYLDENLLCQIGWDIVFRSYEIFCFDEKIKAQYETFKERVISCVSNITGIASDAKDFRSKIYTNTLANSKNLMEPLVLNGLKGSLQNVPAIICGAGESLQKDVKALDLAKNRAVIFAGGSSLRILSDLNIFFHFALAIDPDPLYERFQNLSCFQPVFISLLRNAPFFPKIFHGVPILALEQENHLEKDMFEELNISHKGFDYGWNVGNFQAFVASYLGCSPIIMVGMDMGFQNSEYALELEHESKKHEEHEKLLNGEKFFSRNDLLLGREYFEKLPIAFPKARYVQSQNSKLCPKGFEKQNVFELIRTCSEDDISSRIHQALQNCSKKIKLSEFASKYELNLQNDLNKAIKIFEKIKKICQSLQDKGIPSKSFKEEYLALEEFELENLKTYKVLLQPIWDVWKHLLFRELKDEEGLLEKSILKYSFFQRAVEEFSLQLNKVSNSESSDEK